MRVLMTCGIAALALTGTALAQPAPESPLDPIYRCTAITGAQERLACYDSTVAALRADVGEGRAVVVDREQAEAMRREAFGYSMPLAARLFSGESDDVVGVEAQIVSIQQNGGLATFVLSNGQSWRQTESQRLRGLREDDTVIVRRAAFGSYMLSSTHGNVGYRVRRVE